MVLRNVYQSKSKVVKKRVLMLLVTANEKAVNYVRGKCSVKTIFNMKFLVKSNDFDSSDEEEIPEENNSLHVDWLDISGTGFSNSLGITSLPGCKFGNEHRNLERDIEFLKQSAIQDIFVFCTNEDLQRFHVPTLFQDYLNSGFFVHHFPFEHGDVPSKEQSILILRELSSCLNNQRKTVIHCHQGLGNSCLVAATFMLSNHQNLSPDQVIERLKELRGSRAIQTVKQYNFIHEFKDMAKEEKFHESFPSSEDVVLCKQRKISR